MQVKSYYDTLVNNKSRFTNFSFVEDLNIDISFFVENCCGDRKAFIGQYTDNEKNFLFNFVRKIKPKRIIEFSPCNGYLTCVINGAAGGDDEIEHFESYEIDLDCAKRASINLVGNNFKKTKVVEGDVLEKMDLDKLRTCDLLFIDSNHDEWFVKEYIKRFFPLLPKNCWVHMHDAWFDPINDETRLVTDFIKSRNITEYFYVQDILRDLGVKDEYPNPFNPIETEQSTALWFRI